MGEINVIKKYPLKSLLLFYLCFAIILSSSNPAFAQVAVSTDFDCYGFIVPLPSGDDTTYETFLNGRVRHMINDLLRENVTVYWVAQNFSAISKEMDNNSDIYDIFYKKGAFIIPFSGDIYKDALTTAVMYDYNLTSEIDDCTLKIEAYKLMESTDVSACPLVEPKIAQHLGTATRWGWPCYLQIAEAGGFLTMEFLLDDETAEYLNNDDFNIFMWPYHPAPRSTIGAIRSITNKNGANAIRSFVKNGGGFVGSCYGALAASSGILRPVPIFSLRRAYNPNLSYFRPFVSFSISDSIMDQSSFVMRDLYISTAEIQDTNHPLSFGINKTVKEFFSGPWFIWFGKNSGEVATFKNLQSLRNLTDGNSFFLRSVMDTPTWIDSKFGNGKIVLFTTHPEFVNNISVLFDTLEWKGDEYYGRRTIFNSLFYITSKGLETTNTSIFYPVSFIEELGERTIDLSLVLKNHSEFNDIKTRIHCLNNNLSSLRDIALELYEDCPDIFITDLFETKSKLINYTSHFCDIYSDFNNNTLSSLNKLEQIYPMLLEFNDSVMQLIESLKSDLSWRLNHSEKLVSEVIIMANNLKEIIQQKRLNIIQKLRLITESKDMLIKFEVGLKYIPQTYFETLKLLRYSWYNYEANIALS